MLVEQRGDLRAAVRHALDACGLLRGVTASTRVALKPNLTFPYFKRGVTTSPSVVRETIRALREYTRHVAVVECDGGYGAWKVETAFAGHGLYEIGRELGAEIVNLHEGESEPISFAVRGKTHRISLPTRLLHETDLLITMPVPKVHCMTGLTLGYKNQWGCIPDDMRLRRHYIFDDAIVAINEALAPAVLADGTYFLDTSGPLEGNPVKLDLIIAATDVGAFDRYVSELMGWSWQEVPHLRRAAALGSLPTDIDEIDYNVAPSEKRTHVFRMKRSLRNHIAHAGFVSRFLTWLGYESWFGRVVLHRILYAIAGENVPPSPEDADTPA